MSTQTIEQKNDKDIGPKMMHIAFHGTEKALCGYKFSRAFDTLADGTEDCVVCVEIWKGLMGR